MGEDAKGPQGVSVQAIHRMPYYLQYLKNIDTQNIEMISAPVIAAQFNLSEIQVRKDLSAVSSVSGKPRSGFSVKELIKDIEDLLGYHNINEAVIVGAGNLGKALLAYSGFSEYGLNIVAAFDCDKNIIGQSIGDKYVLDSSTISDVCSRLKIPIGIITVPAKDAQFVCDELLKGGVSGIWNFAPVHLSTPENVLVQNVNMAASLALLSRHLKENSSKEL